MAKPSVASLVLRRDVVLRALGYSAVVGPVLIAINHGDALLAGALGEGRVAKMLLTMLVPYCVSTASSVASLRSAS